MSGATDLERENEILRENLSKKEKEIERLKKENLLLLKVSLKRAEEHHRISETLKKKLKLSK